jgi:hypothetical protein
MQSNLSGRTYLQKLQTFTYGTLALPLLFFVYLYLESSVGRLEARVPEEYHLFAFIPTLSVCLILLFWTTRKFETMRKEAILKTSFVEKLTHYQKANQFRFINYAIAATLCTLGFFLTNFQPFAVLFVIMIVLFSISNPTARRIVSELRLKDQEKQIIYSGSEIL